MKTIVYDFVQRLAWEYLKECNPEEYRESLRVFNKFLSWVVKKLESDKERS